MSEMEGASEIPRQSSDFGSSEGGDYGGGEDDRWLIETPVDEILEDVLRGAEEMLYEEPHDPASGKNERADEAVASPDEENGRETWLEDPLEGIRKAVGTVKGVLGSLRETGDYEGPVPVERAARDARAKADAAAENGAEASERRRLEREAVAAESSATSYHGGTGWGLAKADQEQREAEAHKSGRPAERSPGFGESIH